MVRVEFCSGNWKTPLKYNVNNEVFDRVRAVCGELTVFFPSYQDTGIEYCAHCLLLKARRLNAVR